MNDSEYVKSNKTVKKKKRISLNGHFLKLNVIFIQLNSCCHIQSERTILFAMVNAIFN